MGRQRSRFAFDFVPGRASERAGLRTSVLCVGGLDPTGAAGVVLDAVAIRSIGLHAAVVPAVVTVQDGLRFERAKPVRPLDVCDSVTRVLRTLRVGAVKTGALGTAAVVSVMARLAASGEFPPLVVDPVMRSTTGGMLLDERGIRALRTDLVPRAALVTPNLREAGLLTGLRVKTVEDMERAARRLLDLGPRAVLVKGGHIGGAEVVDVLALSGGEIRSIGGPRVPDTEVRGTGCGLASLAAGLIAMGYPLVESVERARKLLVAAIERAVTVGPGPRVLGFPPVNPIR